MNTSIPQPDRQVKSPCTWPEVLKSIARWLAIPAVARTGLLLLALGFIVYAIVIMLMRTCLPAQLDVFEGKLLSQAWEAASGHKMYRDPILYGAATMYSPIYPLLLAGLLKFVSPAFFWGRFISFIATCATACIFVIFFVKRTARGGTVALLVAAMFASVAWQTDWFGSALKCDALSLLFCVVALVLLLRPGKIVVLISGALLCIAFFTKQTAVIALPGALIFVLINRRTDLLLFILSLGLSVLLVYPIMKWITGDYMAFYVFGRTLSQAESHIQISRVMKNLFAIREMPLTLCGAVLALVWLPRLWPCAAYRMVCVSLPFLMVGSWITASARGAGPNSLMPGFYGLVFLSGFAIEGLLSWRRGETRSCVLIFIMLIFQFDSMWPYHLNKAKGDFDQHFIKLVDYLKSKQGKMYSPTDNVITLLAGRPAYDDRAVAREITWHWQSDAGLKRIEAQMNSQEYDWLICSVSKNDFALLTPETQKNYVMMKDFEEWVVYGKKSVHTVTP